MRGHQKKYCKFKFKDLPRLKWNEAELKEALIFLESYIIGFTSVVNFWVVVDKSIESIIQAHESDVGALAVNADGTLIATASIRGTIIRIFSAEEGQLLQELRRGSSKAFITSLNFHPSMNMIACTSNRSSIHLFEIKKSVEKCIDSKHVGFSNENSTKNPDGENKKSK